MKALPILAGAAGMTFVGGSVAVSGHLAGAPALTVQALRYAVACLLLLGWSACTRTPVRRPRGAEWRWLLGVTVAGLLVFNIALMHGARHAEPAVLGVAVACVPILLAAGGPLLQGHRPAARTLLAAGVVTLGAIGVEGLGRADRIGVFWAVVTFLCEALFTLLAVPVLGRHGPLGVSVHATGMAVVLFGAAGLVTEGPGAVLRLHAGDVLAGAYLAVAVTAVAFVLWYTCVTRIGPGRAGLLTGLAPIAAALTGMGLGGPAPRPLVWLGMATVAAGLALGLTARPDRPAAAGGGRRSPRDRGGFRQPRAGVGDHSAIGAGSGSRGRESAITPRSGRAPAAAGG
ncbi:MULTISPECIES: DMT family transporter [unclassified Actinoplanes]|uniref:DMT family transporter n=1 Tax=unclassified Actinoplanes TaxID=2626549 RepID=UPI0002EE00BA|nr:MULTISPECIES: DMT family transporter [unclassified Actinoplanes]